VIHEQDVQVLDAVAGGYADSLPNNSRDRSR